MDINFEPLDIKKFGQMKSKEHNKMQDDLAFDLYNLNKSISEGKALYKHLYQMLKYENYVLDKEIDNIKKEIKNHTEDKEFTYINFYNNDNILLKDSLDKYDLDNENYNLASIHYNYNSVMPKVTSKISKTFFEKSNYGSYIPDNLLIESEDIDLDDNPIDIETNNLKNAINQDIDKFWYKRYIFNEEQSVDSIKEEVTINLSESILANNRSNLLVINTYPNTECNVINAKYKLNNESDYRKFDNEYIKTDTLGRLLFLFNKKDISAIKFELENSTPNLLDEGTRKIFALGLQNVALYNARFKKESHLFLKVNTEGIDKINDITFNTTNKGNKDNINYQLYGVDIKSNDLIPIQKDTTISTNYNKDIIIKITIDAEDLPPILNGVIVDYDLVD